MCVHVTVTVVFVCCNMTMISSIYLSVCVFLGSIQQKAALQSRL